VERGVGGGGVSPPPPTSVMSVRWVYGRKGLVLHTEDEASGGLVAPYLETPLKRSKLTRLVLVRVTGSQFSKKLTACLVGICFEVLAHFWPVGSKGIWASTPSMRASRRAVFQWPYDDSPRSRRHAPDFEHAQQGVNLARVKTAGIFRAELIEQLGSVEIWASLQAPTDLWPDHLKRASTGSASAAGLDWGAGRCWITRSFRDGWRRRYGCPFLRLGGSSAPRVNGHHDGGVDCRRSRRWCHELDTA
jgi:hypothetical protein